MQEIKQEKSQIKQNILRYLRSKEISEYKFYKESGITRGILQQPNGISEDNLSRFLDYANDVNTHWLLTGRGEMLKTNGTTRYESRPAVPISSCEDTDNQATNQIKDTKRLQTRPRIPFEAAAGSLSIAVDSIQEDQCERLPVIKSLPKYDFTIIARGESMAPVIESGDELACRFNTESTFIQWGRTYVLDTTVGIIVKRIFDNGEYIVCRSNNPEFPEFPVHKKEIYHMALVVGLVRQF